MNPQHRMPPCHCGGDGLLHVASCPHYGNGCTCPPGPHRVRAHCPVHGWTPLAAMERELAKTNEESR